MLMLRGLFLVLTFVTALLRCSAPAHADGDDYPSKWRDAPQDSFVDDWGHFNRECTSFVSWRLHSRNGYEIPFHDNANRWGPRAKAKGIEVNMTPAIGSVAWWEPPKGYHVAWVSAVQGTKVTIEEYNATDANHDGIYDGAYGARVIDANSVSGYIHFKDFDKTADTPSALPDGQIVENLDTNPRLRYVAAGGRLFWYDRFNATMEHAFIDQMKRKLGTNAQIVERYGEEIHSIETNYPSGATHRPNNNTFMYEYPGGTQYMIQYDYAFPLTSAEEVSYLGGVNKAIMVPPGSIAPLTARADAMPNIQNARALKALAIPDYYEVQDGRLYWLDNFTVLDCLVRYKGGAVQQVPASLINTFMNVGRRTGQISHCEFPSNAAFYGPGGWERWYIYGTNPYDRYRYAGQFAMFCRIGQDAPQIGLSTPGLNQATEKANLLQCPDGSFVRNRQNNEVFYVTSGVLHYVPTYDAMGCLANGAPPDPKGIDEGVLGTVPRGTDAVCSFEGKLIIAPRGDVYWIKDGQRHYINNQAILHCIQVRTAARGPIPATDQAVNSFPEGDVGFCPYPSDIRFVRGANQTAVWRVFPDGTRQHAVNLCSTNAEDPSTDARFRVHIVPTGEVDGHQLRNPATFSATPEACASVP